ncbi:protein kinase domain-containing protein [Nonomuraea sp. SBT364]|uniref:protein kinase domain-containing protein n=1 Tax=Nonomuraea sp. SBT364 TaxID=1580530 RepID=UPI00066B3BB0|nr:hypothetical protein [Nonomuraea sp. SBT364]
MTSIHATEFEDLLLSLVKGTAGSPQLEGLLSTDERSRRDGAFSFLRNIMDHISDYEYQQNDVTFIEACDRAIAELTGEADASRLPIAGILALIALNAKLLERRFARPDRALHRAADAYCRNLFTTTAIKQVVHIIYGPAETEGTAFERTSWRQINPDTFDYHRAGTTSFILKATTTEPIDESGAERKLAVKCVLFPWNKLTAIAQATDEYARVYGGARTPSLVVHPIASTERWILMPFQEGRTLSEQLAAMEDRTPPAPLPERLAACREMAGRLTTALHRLASEAPVDPARQESQHLDLSPSNILIAAESGDIKFIDLGANHLYSRQVGIADHDDSVYIAPEVKNKGTSPSADAYSVGIILIQMICGYPPRDGRAPDEIWQLSPDLGRALEDLIEEDHHKRLLLLPDGPATFALIGTFLDHAIELAQKEPDASASEHRRRLARALPTSIEVSTQYSQWRLSKRLDIVRAEDGYLLLFAFLATACWWFILAKTALFKLDDIVTLEMDDLPRGVELAAQIIALSQGLIGAKFYQTILARLTARRVPGTLARITEASIRLMPFVALLTTITSVFWIPALWAWGCAVGAALVAVCNWLTLTLTTRMYQAGLEAGLSTVPPVGELRARGYEQWWWTMLLYAVVITVIAAGLQTGLMKDLWAYVFGLVLISVGIHYISKFVVAGPGVRAELARAFAAGERVAILDAREGGQVKQWPPRW